MVGRCRGNGGREMRKVCSVLCACLTAVAVEQLFSAFDGHQTVRLEPNVTTCKCGCCRLPKPT